MKKYNNGYSFEISNNNTHKNKRSIPLSIILKIWFGSSPNILGIILSLFMLPFSLIMVPFADIFSTSFNDDDPVTVGVITESNVTGGSINGDGIYEYKYQYELADGRIYSRTGYTTGESRNVGDEIKISYKKDNPAKFRAHDIRNSLFEGIGSAIMILVFQAAGLTLLYFGTRKAIRRIYILRVGVLANGLLIDRDPPDEKINNQTLYTLTFEFTASDYKKYKVVLSPVSVERLTDDGYEMLVYDPENPEKAILLDHLPKGIKDFFLKLV